LNQFAALGRGGEVLQKLKCYYLIVLYFQKIAETISKDYDRAYLRKIVGAVG
jgi:hypothetical protein